jgi:hypothetical protein
MLGLKVVCHKDRSLEVTWGGDCSEWLARGPPEDGSSSSPPAPPRTRMEDNDIYGKGGPGSMASAICKDEIRGGQGELIF